jgi:glycine cleavage system H protein
MSPLPEHLKYAESHEWVYLDQEGLAVVGITDFAQGSLGDLMDVSLPEVGAVVAQGDDVMSLESVKAASDIYSPLTGEIVAVNDALEDEPELINDEPYDSGWLFKMAPTDTEEMSELMDASEYERMIEQ